MKIFDLEQSLMSCWQIIDDLELLAAYIYDDEFFQGIDPKHADFLHNKLSGLKDVYEMRFNKQWADFESMTKEYHNARKSGE